MRAVTYLLLGFAMVAAALLADFNEYLQIALLSSGTTLSGVGILMDVEEDRRG